MRLAGLQKLTLLDFPDQVACTVFTSGCDLRCPFCQNPDLVLPELIRDTEVLSEESFFEFLEKRKGKLGGVAITGGEPTLHADLPQFMERIRSMGYLVKLDSNGLHPEALRKILDGSLADYIAMDVKNSPAKYAMTVGIRENTQGELWARASESIALLMNGSTPFEFRTTVVEGLHTEEDILDIARELRGARAWYLQQFIGDRDLVGSFGQDKMDLATPAPGTLRKMCRAAAEYVPNVQVRGI